MVSSDRLLVCVLWSPPALPGASCGRSEQARLALGCRKVQIVLTARTPLTERASTAASSRRDPVRTVPFSLTTPFFISTLMSLKSDFSRTFFTSLSISSRFNDHDPHETRAHVASVVELFSRRRRTLAAAVRLQRRVRHAATPRLRATRRAAQHRSPPTEPCSTAPYPSV
jgi:hypothetical protein